MLPPTRPRMPMGLPTGPLGAPMGMTVPRMPGMPALGMPHTLPSPVAPTGPTGPAPCGACGLMRPMTMTPCGGTMPRPMMPMPMDASMPRPMASVIPPPPGGMRPQMIPAPAQPFNPSLPPRPPSLPQQLAQLQAAGQEGQRHAPPPPPPPPAFQGDKKPQLFMLIAQLAPHVQEQHGRVFPSMKHVNV